VQLFPFEAKPKPGEAALAMKEADAHAEPEPETKPAADPPAEKKRKVDQLSLADARKLISLDSGVKVIVAMLLIAAIGIRLRPSAADWGWTLAHWQRDLAFGCGTFLATFAPMIGLQAALVFGLGWKYEHPMIDLVTRTKDPLLFGLSALAAAVLAPLFEEFVFRGLLQGWLEKIFSGRSGAKAILLGGTDEELPEVQAVLNELPGSAPANEPLDLNPYAAPHAHDELQPSLSDQTLVPPTRVDWLAIFCSMLVFSLLHFSHGPAWIPLLIFGAAVGFVYQRTHRIWPGIIAHMLLNGTTIFGLWVQVFGGIPK
jgi:membrane protease YdiL (CAAX protease family)